MRFKYNPFGAASSPQGAFYNKADKPALFALWPAAPLSRKYYSFARGCGKIICAPRESQTHLCKPQLKLRHGFKFVCFCSSEGARGAAHPYPHPCHAEPRAKRVGLKLSTSARCRGISEAQADGQTGETARYGSPSLWGAGGNLLPTEGAFLLLSTSPTTRSRVWPPPHTKGRPYCGIKGI